MNVNSEHNFACVAWRTKSGFLKVGKIFWFCKYRNLYCIKGINGSVSKRRSPFLNVPAALQDAVNAIEIKGLHVGEKRKEFAQNMKLMKAVLHGRRFEELVEFSLSLYAEVINTPENRPANVEEKWEKY